MNIIHKGNLKFIICTVLSTILIIILCIDKIISAEFKIFARIESKRKGSLVTILFKNEPSERKYYIINKKRIIGEVNILTVIHNRKGQQKLRAIAAYHLNNIKYNRLIRVGAEIALLKKAVEYKRDFSDLPYNENIKYINNITSKIDKREMVLIPAGKFVFGSNLGDRDEYPEQIVHLGDYYIDKYEISNKEYKVFIDMTNSKPPLSWEGGTFKKEHEYLPVLVTYYEAEAYTKWAGKRLPTEVEWEKAARGRGVIDNNVPIGGNVYPWGIKFISENVNSIEFWLNERIGKKIKNEYQIYKKSLLPVYLFKKNGASQYGIINMSGNAMEWTSSWYMPYKGNKRKDKRYGTQYKVIRGGAWFSNQRRVRVTCREVGGLPNLYLDNIAGFRCVRDATYIMREHQNE